MCCREDVCHTGAATLAGGLNRPHKVLLLLRSKGGVSVCVRECERACVMAAVVSRAQRQSRNIPHAGFQRQLFSVHKVLRISPCPSRATSSNLTEHMVSGVTGGRERVGDSSPGRM